MATKKGEIIYLKDDEGNTTKWYRRDGHISGVFRDTVEECDKLYDDIKLFSPRPDDVWICAFAKSGTHWLWEVVSMLLSGATELIPIPKEHLMLEDCDAETLEKLSSPRVLNSHHMIDVLPPGIWKTRSKIIHPVRNIKDALVSLYYHKQKNGSCKGSFEAFNRFNDESVTKRWYSYENEWWLKHRDNPDVLFLKYEEALKDPAAMVRTVADFLGVSVTEERVTLVAQKTSFQNMKTNKVEREQDVKGTYYRKGQAGDWKNHFTVAMTEEFDKKHTERMKDITIGFDFEH